MSAAAALPDDCRAVAAELLRSALPGADASLIARCLHEVAALWSPAMTASAFRFRARGAVYAFAQREMAAHSVHDPVLLRRHIEATLSRCLPGIATADMVSRCLMTLYDADGADDPMHTGAIHQFAARELLADPQTDDPLRQRLHASALRHLPTNRPVDRDDLRLVALDALYDPSILPRSPHAGFFRLRLGLKDTPPHSCEEIAALLHIPLTLVREIEAGALAALSAQHHQRRPTHA